MIAQFIWNNLTICLFPQLDFEKEPFHFQNSLRLNDNCVVIIVDGVVRHSAPLPLPPLMRVSIPQLLGALVAHGSLLMSGTGLQLKGTTLHKFLYHSQGWLANGGGAHVKIWPHWPKADQLGQAIPAPSTDGVYWGLCCSHIVASSSAHCCLLPFSHHGCPQGLPVSKPPLQSPFLHKPNLRQPF